MSEVEKQAIIVLNTLHNNPLLSDIHRQALEVGVIAIKALNKIIDAADEYAEDSSSEKSNKWIPVKYRPMTDEEKKDYSERTGYDIEDLDSTLDCPLPEDGETVLITDRLGNVIVDTFINDCDGCYFECNCDMDDITAWMPLPKPYDGGTQHDD